jgi:2-keto-4-pentenoate hydratase/2-oxohepta-3-ene-1,7-dioic acid hydratase in catechol pathway
MTIRLGNVGVRAVLLVDDALVDVGDASNGRFGPGPMEVLARWDEFRGWAGGVTSGEQAADGVRLGPPVPRPSKVFGIGLNYRAHAKESGSEPPSVPQVFTKFPSCLVGPADDVVLPSATTDYEAELVVVVGRGGRGIAEGRAVAHIAGYMVGQDISERRVQMAGDRPQFSMGKSYDTFGPTGPVVVSLDEFADPDDLALRCDVAGERMQDSRTSDLIFSVPELIAYISSICTLEPGDLIFTGTPEGVGAARRPPRFLRDGDVIASTIEGVGTITNTCVNG